MNSVPFVIDDVFGGFAEAEGILSLVDGALCLEYRTKDAFFGAIQSRPATVRIPAEAIEELQFTRRWVRKATLCVRVGTIQVIADLPGASAAEVRLQIDRRDVARAEAFLADARLAIAERRLDQLRGQA